VYFGDIRFRLEREREREREQEQERERERERRLERRLALWGLEPGRERLLLGPDSSGQT